MTYFNFKVINYFYWDPFPFALYMFKMKSALPLNLGMMDINIMFFFIIEDLVIM